MGYPFFCSKFKISNHCCPVKMAFRFLSWFLVFERSFLEVFKMNLPTFEQA